MKDESTTGFTHLRAFSGWFDLAFTVTNKGGATIAYKTTDDGRHIAAVAYCNPTDNFSRPFGRNKAEARMKELEKKHAKNDDFKFFEEPSDARDLGEFVNSIVAGISDSTGYARRVKAS